MADNIESRASEYWNSHPTYSVPVIPDNELSKMVSEAKDYMPDIYFGFYNRPLFKSYTYDRSIYEYRIRGTKIKANSFITLLTDHRVYDSVDVLRDYIEEQIFDPDNFSLAQKYAQTYIETNKRTGKKYNKYVGLEAIRYSLQESGEIYTMYINYYLRKATPTLDYIYFSTYLGLFALFLNHLKAIDNDVNYILDTDSTNIGKYMATVIKLLGQLDNFSYRGYNCYDTPILKRLNSIFGQNLIPTKTPNKNPYYNKDLFLQHYQKQPEKYKDADEYVTLAFVTINESIIKKYGDLTIENANGYTLDTLKSLHRLLAPSALIIMEFTEIPSVGFYVSNIMAHIRRQMNDQYRYNGAIGYGDVISKTHHADGLILVLQKV